MAKTYMDMSLVIMVKMSDSWPLDWTNPGVIFMYAVQ